MNYLCALCAGKKKHNENLNLTIQHVKTTTQNGARIFQISMLKKKTCNKEVRYKNLQGFSMLQPYHVVLYNN